MNLKKIKIIYSSRNIALKKEVAGQLGPWTTRPVDSSARSGQLGPYVPDNSARRYNLY